MTMKRISLAALGSLLAASVLAVAQSTPSGEPARPGDEQLQVQPPLQPEASRPSRMEEAKVVSVDEKRSSLTVKVGSDQKQVTLEDKAAVALKVVRAGDDVRLFLKDDGRAMGVVIINPANSGSKADKQ